MSSSAVKKTQVDLDDYYEWSIRLYKHAPLSDYFSDRAIQDADEKINRDAEFFNDKRHLERILPPGFVVETLGVFDHQAVLGDIDVLTSTDLVLKPINDTQGNGVVRFPEGLSLADIEYLTNTLFPCIATKYYPQHAYAEQVWPHSSNTLRFLTYYTTQMNVAACVQKWGTKASGFKDNWSKGGITTWVNRKGLMTSTFEDYSPVDHRSGKGSTRPSVSNGRVNWLTHPESGMNIFENQVPFWSETLDMLASASEIVFPGMAYCGWDVIITPDGPKIIEANPWPGVQLIQVHKPLLQDQEFVNFLKSYGVEGLNGH